MNIRVEDHFVDAAPHNGTRDNTVVRPLLIASEYLEQLMDV